MIIFELILNQYFLHILLYFKQYPKLYSKVSSVGPLSMQNTGCPMRYVAPVGPFSPLWRTYPSPTGAGVVTHRDSMCGCGGQCLLVAVLTALSVLRFLRCCSSGGPNVAAGGWHGLRWETGSMGDRLAGATQGPVSIQWRLSP